MTEQQQETEQKDDQERVSSPTLDHLDETIEDAKRAADEALAPQRD